MKSWGIQSITIYPSDVSNQSNLCSRGWREVFMRHTAASWFPLLYRFLLYCLINWAQDLCIRMSHVENRSLHVWSEFIYRPTLTQKFPSFYFRRLHCFRFCEMQWDISLYSILLCLFVHVMCCQYFHAFNVVTYNRESRVYIRCLTGSSSCYAGIIIRILLFYEYS